MSEIDKPNVSVPLVASFNQRGLAGYTQAVTNSDDQIKLNSIYEPIQNAATGKNTLYLSKRPGVKLLTGTWGTSSQISYLHDIDVDGAGPVLFYTVGDDIITENGASTLITTAAGYAPAFVDKTMLANDVYLVLQLRNSTGGMTHWLSNNLAVGFTQFTTSAGSDRGKMEFLDGYAFTTDVNDGGQIYNSQLNTLSTWPASNFVTRRAKLDQATGLGRFGSQLISWGTASMEVYRNAGTPFGSPLEFVPSLTQEYGLERVDVVGMRHYYAIVGGKLYWKGANPHGVFAYNGQTVEKVSSLAVDKILAERQHYFIGPLGFSGQVALVIGLDLVTAATQRSLLFFPAWKDWFLWTSTVFIPQANPRDDNLFLGVSSNQHRLYSLHTSSNVFTDAGTNYEWLHQFKLPKPGNGFQRLDMFGLMGDTATAALNISTQFSFDDWGSLTSGRVIDMTSHDKRITRCGGMRTPVGVRLSYTGTESVRLEAAIARIT